MDISKKHVISNLIWKLFERVGSQGIAFIVSIVLARLLTPEEYGIIALITVFISVANIIIQSGMNTALIQKKQVTEGDFSSVFFLSIIMAAIIYIILYLTAPLIAGFYNMNELTWVLRVLSLILFPGAFNSIQVAYISKRLEFKKLFYSSMGAVVISGGIGIGMAYVGAGVWSLVGQQLINQVTITIILLFVARWRPKAVFSLWRVRELFAFGWKLLCSNLIDTIYQNLYNLVIGKLYNKNLLGLYNQGSQYPKFIVSNINGAIQSVMLPVFSEKQDDLQSLKNMLRRSIMTSAFLIFPMMLGLAAIAEPLVYVLLTEKWKGAIVYLQISCITYAFWPIHAANLQAINAIGRSDIFLVLEIIKKIVGVLVLIACIPYGVTAMVAGQAVVSFLATLINAFPNKKLLHYSYFEQMKDFGAVGIISVIMAGIVYLTTLLAFPNGIKVVVGIAVGIIVYVLLCILTKNESYYYVWNNLKLMRRRTPHE